MKHALTPALRQALADLLLAGEFRPESAALGRGGYDPATYEIRPTQGALYEAAPDLYPALAVLRSEQHEVQLIITLPEASDFTEFSELAVFSANGTCLLHATFLPQVLGAGVEAAFEFTLLPEVQDAAEAPAPR